MLAIILAAGMGRRLSLGMPKCLIDIAGTTILERQVTALRGVGIERFVIVVGYQQDAVRQKLQGQAGTFEFVVNDRFAETNTIYSLYLARQHFGDGFFYCNGDVLFDRRLIERLMPADAASLLAVQPGRCGQEEVKVMVEPCEDAAGRSADTSVRITRIGKMLDPALSLGEFVGVARFGSAIVPAFGEALVRCVEIDGIVGDHFEQALDRLCRAGQVLTPVDIGELPCGEIDFQDDLRYACEKIAPRLTDQS